MKWTAFQQADEDAAQSHPTFRLDEGNTQVESTQPFSHLSQPPSSTNHLHWLIHLSSGNLSLITQSSTHTLMPFRLNTALSQVTVHKWDVASDYSRFRFPGEDVCRDNRSCHSAVENVSTDLFVI